MSSSSTATTRGLLGRKLGMTQVWDADNKIVPVTVIAADTNVVTQIRTRETDGYSAVQLGFGQIDPRKVNKPLTGHFEKAGVTPRRHPSSSARATPPTTSSARRSRPRRSSPVSASTSPARPRARVSPAS